MDITGIWTIKEIMMFDENLNKVWKTKEQALADKPEDDDTENLFSSRFAFCDDGFVRTVIPIPEGASQKEIDQAVAAGEAELCGDGCISVEKHPWKIEDGKIMIDSGAKGEVLGEEISPWVEAPLTDGVLQYLMFRLVKE